MAPYGIPTSQFDDYARGVHGKALLEDRDTGAPACNDCHGNHGALPPGTASVTQVCGNCHVNNLKYFEGTRMAAAFAEEDLHGCEECHGNHAVMPTSDAMVGVTDESVCMDCHDTGDNGYVAADSISMQLASLVAAYDSATVMQAEVQRIGMDDEEMAFTLKEAHQNLIQARTLVHTFEPRQVAPQTDEGMGKVREAMVMAAQLKRESVTRRRGFGMATIFITVLVIALVFKIRELDAKLPQR
jgi:predicted CXXCH cytochrome family protein